MYAQLIFNSLLPGAQPLTPAVLYNRGDMVQTLATGERLIGMVDGIFTHSDAMEPTYGIRFIDRRRGAFRIEPFMQSQLARYVPLWDMRQGATNGVATTHPSFHTTFVPSPMPVSSPPARDTATPP